MKVHSAVRAGDRVPKPDWKLINRAMFVRPVP